MKKIVSLLVTLSLLVGMALTPVYAQAAGSKGGGGGQPQAQGDRPSGGNQPGNAATDSHMQNGNANTQDDSQNSNPGNSNKPDQNNGNNPGQNNGNAMGQIDESSLEAAIASVEDSDTAASLTALLTAYQTAAEGDDQEAAKTALQALLSAMRTAGVQAETSQPGGKGFGEPDTDAIAESIATLTDTDTVTSLTALLAAYQTAAEGDDQTATQTALQALLAAMETAGLDTDDYTPAEKPDDKGMAPVDTDAIAESIATLTDSDTVTSLTALLAAYQTAAEGDDNAATQSALQALLAAMETAGLDTTTYETPEKKVAALLDTDRVAAAINALTDTDTAASLTALLTAYQTAVEGGDATAVKAALEALKNGLKDAGLMQSYDRASEQGQAMRTLGERYGRFLDVSRVEAAIEELGDSLTATNLSDLLAAYEAAAAGSDADATRAALDALLAAMKDANLQMERIEDSEHRVNMDDGTYLDTDKVTIAISTLEDTDVAAALTALLQTYETALASGDRTVTQTAFRALLDAMETAGLQV